MENLTSYEFSKLLKDLEQIFHIYDFKKEHVLDLLNYSGSYEEYNDEELLELEGVTNAILFNLKYKM